MGSAAMVAGLAFAGFMGAAHADLEPQPSDDSTISEDGYDYDTMPLPIRRPGSTAPPLEYLNKPVEAQPGSIDMIISPEHEKALQDQLPLFELNAEVAAISALLPSDPATASTFDVANKTLILYWHGAVPAEIVALQESARARGYEVAVLPSAYTRSQLKAAAEKITGQSGGPAGLSVALNTDGSGLTVTYPGLDGVRVSADGKTRYEANEAILDAIDVVVDSGMPVSVEKADGDGAVPFTTKAPSGSTRH